MQPHVTGQQPRQGGEHRTVRPVRSRAGDLPAQDRDLVPEHEIFRVLRGVISGQEHQPAKNPDHEEVNETDEHDRRA